MTEVDRINLEGVHDQDAVRAAMRRQVQRFEMLKWLRQAAADRSGGALWYVVQVAGVAPNRLADQLREAAIEAWAPMQTIYRRRRRSQSKDKVLVPVLPGFIFVKVPAFEAAWLGVLSFEGAAAILSAGDLPTPVPEKTINELKAITDPTAVRFLFSAGDKVTIEAGPFKSFEAQIVDRENYRTCQVKVDVEVFGRMTRCTLDVDDLKRLD